MIATGAVVNTLNYIRYIVCTVGILLIHGRQGEHSGCAPKYLATYCVPVSSTAARQHLRSAVRHQLAVPSHRLSSDG